MDTLMDIRTAAERLGLAVPTLRAWVRLRRIPHVRLGRRILFEPDGLSRFIAERRAGPAAGVKGSTDAHS